MIITETVVINNNTFKHTFSSDFKYILQVETGAIYDEAYDVAYRNFNYVETDSIIPQELRNPD